jgi:mannose-6-phosphate isomerase-like protein (cupin superfamily)
MPTATVLTAEKTERHAHEWGALTWFASAALGNSQDLTVGRCVLKPGCGNPPHRHPNCSEVLVVVQGTIRHTVDEQGGEVVLRAGDCVTVPAGFKHCARNVGQEEAVLFVAFSSAHRQVQGE